MAELVERLNNLTRAGFDATLLVRSAAAAGPLPYDHPAAALWWRILDQLPETPNQEPATPAAVPATGRTTTTSHDKQRPLPRSAPSRVRAEPVKRSTHHNAGRSVSQDLLPNSSADQGRLLRGGDWQSGAGYDISVRDGSARRSRTTLGGCL
jgi:hypothetical protein